MDAWRNQIAALRRLREQGAIPPEMAYADIAETAPEGYGAPQYAPIDYGQQMDALPQPVRNALVEAMRVSDLAEPPAVMPRTMQDDPRRYKAASYDPARDAESPVPTNSMRNNQTGEITPLNFTGAGTRQPLGGGLEWEALASLNPAWGQQQQPRTSNSTGRPAVGGFDWGEINPAWAQQPQSRTLKVYGAGNDGIGYDLGSQEATGPIALDRTQAPIDIPGVGRAIRAKDGHAYVLGADGQPATKVVLGYDRAASMASGKFDQQRRKGEAEIAQTEEQIAASRATRAQREDPATQLALEKRFGKAEKGYQWTAEGKQVPMPGGPTDQGQVDSIAAAGDTIRKIDEMLAHPGMKDAVGAKWSGGLPMALGFKPVPGTDAADFASRLDEIKGGAFLQAFESLKGGGAITEVEGKKATDAITRMNAAQSEKEFVLAAKEFQGVVRRGMEKAQTLRGGQAQAPAQGGGNQAALVAEAKAAIARGAPRDAVLKRLREHGVTAGL